MTIELPDLPYPGNALEPFISAQTVAFHHGAHECAYVEKTNALVQGTALAGKTLEQIIGITAPKRPHSAIFNNAAQAWNHAFYWRSMSPGAGGAPKGLIGDRIKQSFRSYASFSQAFSAAATGHFGSGWVWLILNHDKLRVTASANADTPIAHGIVPLLTIDVWEHAYYLDYRNRRAEYVANFLARLANWSFAESNLLRASRNMAAE
jgi:Fe-Mn family superoxide dismutase